MVALFWVIFSLMFILCAVLCILGLGKDLLGTALMSALMIPLLFWTTWMAFHQLYYHNHKKEAKLIGIYKNEITQTYCAKLSVPDWGPIDGGHMDEEFETETYTTYAAAKEAAENTLRKLHSMDDTHENWVPVTE